MHEPQIYKNIKMLRLQKSWSQTELAKRVGYSDKSMIAKIENGKVDLTQSKILDFANVFGTTPSELMGWDTDDPEINEIVDVINSKMIRPDAEEIDIIKAYRAADDLTKQMVLRLLKVGD